MKASLVDLKIVFGGKAGILAIWSYPPSSSLINKYSYLMLEYLSIIKKGLP